MSPRNVLVTGAYGLLGTALVRSLLERGDAITVIRRDKVRESPLVLDGLEQHVVVVDGDICDAALMDRAVGEYEVDTLFHLAAQTIVPTANRSPAPTFEANVRGTWTVLEACRIHEVQRTVVASSDKAYGSQPVLPYTEDMALLGQHPYDASKAATDLIARSYWHTYGLRVAVTRFANLYGGGDLNPSRLIPGAIGAALAGERPLIRSDGSPERDFMYVGDAAAAYLAICDALDGEHAAGEAFNAGSGIPRTALSVVEAAIAATGASVTPDLRGDGVPHGEIDRQYLDSTKLRELTGWEAKVGLEEGLERTVAWTRAHLAR
jgi:CDP-glucose 4,6-dehydratase